MNFLKKIFGKAKATLPKEPIFPEENFCMLRLNMADGLAIATVNKAYDNYHNKIFYPFLVGIELEIVDKNDNGHPVETEAIRLNQIQHDIEALLKQKHTVHSVARVTRNGARDILIYIDKPRLQKKEIAAFCNNIRKERKMLFSIQKDICWKSVAGFMK